LANSGTTRDNIIKLFTADDDADVAEAPLAALRPPPQARTPSTVVTGIDLTGRPKLLMTFGPGRSGKTLVLRWLAERALERNVEINLATVDAARPALKLFFPEVIAPGAPERVTFWLERMISRLMSAPRHVAIDFGADMTLEPILRQAPNLTEMLEPASSHRRRR
jgi:hypothetical protein